MNFKKRLTKYGSDASHHLSKCQELASRFAANNWRNNWWGTAEKHFLAQFAIGGLWWELCKTCRLWNMQNLYLLFITFINTSHRKNKSTVWMKWRVSHVFTSVSCTVAYAALCKWWNLCTVWPAVVWILNRSFIISHPHIHKPAATHIHHGKCTASSHLTDFCLKLQSYSKLFGPKGTIYDHDLFLCWE